MTDQLPPSKFGAGYTYGGSASASPPSPSPVNPATFPNPVPPPPTQYGTTAASTPDVAYGAPVTQFLPAAARVSGGTAIAAGVLALVIGAYRAFATYAYFATVAMLGDAGSSYAAVRDMRNYATAAGVISAIGTLALVVGAIRLFNRGLGGRGLITMGCLIAIADVVLMWISVMGWVESLFGSGSIFGEQGLNISTGDVLAEAFSRQGPSIVIHLLVTIGIPLLTIVLAFSKSTRRWCEAGRAPGPYGTRTY
ncbi:hypothetical protein EV580_3310 [Mycobacterium sp. BK086]|uniref:hypothetical protein n=1 Tax=Mycobacterium sp. BK086 TaxID=2512165 RepID=UPI00105CCB33|nr:hypothetical protein [Mycobacterium sp. BK086]TDO15168.1 hypothetical protein EV580_3310 [Mycobacterium sp. BK086]